MDTVADKVEVNCSPVDITLLPPVWLIQPPLHPKYNSDLRRCSSFLWITPWISFPRYLSGCQQSLYLPFSSCTAGMPSARSAFILLSNFWKPMVRFPFQQIQKIQLKITFTTEPSRHWHTPFLLWVIASVSIFQLQ